MSSAKGTHECEECETSYASKEGCIQGTFTKEPYQTYEIIFRREQKISNRNYDRSMQGVP